MARSSPERLTVALLCPEPRWRRVLSLVLEAEGLAVLDWPAKAAPPPSSIVVVDLDSLGWGPAEAIGRLGGETPMLLLSVYPQHLDLSNGRPLALLQPPFRWREFRHRVRCLLRA
jgi:hypothetical protein